MSGHVGLVVASCLLQWCLAIPGGLALSPDTSALQAFQASAYPAQRILNWTGGEPCKDHWTGVECDGGGNVRAVVLEGMSLTGSITALGGLAQLRLLSLKDNAFTGTIPEMNRWRSLRHLYLHNNNLSGSIPDSIGSATKLLRFTAGRNFLTGRIPIAVGSLTHLATLRLESNRLSGAIPLIQLRNLSDFNVSHNQLAGAIPSSLDKFGASAFQGNPMLCGRPLFPAMICNGTIPTTVPSTQSTDPGAEISVGKRKRRDRMSAGAIIAIALGDAFVFLLICILSATYYWRKYPAHETRKKVECSEAVSVSQSGENCKLVFFEHSGVRFGLGALLRASAEMLGKGSFGTAYKAVLEDGRVVTVKRMKDVMHASSRKEFEQKMDIIGKLWHPNALPLQAYYFAKEEKLLVYDYEPNGSLHSLLHGNRGGPGRVVLNWSTRFGIALGVAKALRYLHHECGKQKLCHGNVKSSNILLDENRHPLVADFGLALITNPTAATSRLAGYRAPEHAGSKRISQPADVYSFGVVMLELLTGKAPAPFHPSEKCIDLPKWVHSVVREEWTAEVFDLELMHCTKSVEEDMVSMLQTALLCTDPLPDRRPKMTVVVALLEKLCLDLSHPLDSFTTSVCQSPSPSEVDVGTASDS